MKSFEFKIWHVQFFVRNLTRRIFFQNQTRCLFFTPKSDTYFFLFKIWRVVIFSVQNLTRCIFFYSKSVALYFLCFKICLVLRFLNQNLPFKSCFQILAENISKFSQHQRKTCWKMTTTWGKKIFYENVACVCLTFGAIFFVFALFMANGFLMGVMTISFALPME